MTSPNKVIQLYTDNKKTIRKLPLLEKEHYYILRNYIAELLNTAYETINYTEHIYTTKTGNTRSKIQVYITEKQTGKIINITTILFLLFRIHLNTPVLNTTNNYILSDITALAEIYTRISAYITQTRKHFNNNTSSKFLLNKIQ